MNQINRYKEIENHLVKRGSGTEAIDEYVQEKINRNNLYWITICIIAVGIVIASSQWS